MLVGAAACSLVAMVARITRAGKRYEGVRGLADRLVQESDALRERMLHLRDRDEAAFNAVIAARGDKAAMQRALSGAAEVPLQGATAAARAMTLAYEALALENANLVSDVGCAAEFGYAAMAACVYNVRINHKYMEDKLSVEAQRAHLEQLESQGDDLVSRVRTAVNKALSK